MNGWGVVYTQAGAETKAAANLRRQSFETYLPCYLRTRSHARRKEQVIAPLFPRYLFVRWDLDVGRWRSINGTLGVSRLLCNGDKPLMIAPDVVDAIRHREDVGGFVALEDEQFTGGQPLRINAGPFAEYIGLFQKMADSQRVQLLLEFLGHQTRLVVSRSSVMALAN